MSSEAVYLLLGSNLGDRPSVMREAIRRIAAEVGPVVAESSVYETEPWGFADQPPFLNMVVKAETSLSPEQVLKRILGIEQELGRVRDRRWGARLIDIDLLYYGERVVRTPDLVVPHPRLSERRFTLKPLCEIAPDFVHPVFLKSNLRLLESCGDDSAVTLSGQLPA